jgi:hypothetical protein
VLQEDDHLSLSAHKQRKVKFPLSQFEKCVAKAKAKVKAKVSATRTLKPNIGIAASLFTFVLSFSQN